MTVEEFLHEMIDVLQTERSIDLSTVLSDLTEWDSLSIMATMAFLDKTFNVKTTIDDFKEMKTIGDIALRAGIK